MTNIEIITSLPCESEVKSGYCHEIVLDFDVYHMNIPIVELLLLFQVSQNWFGEEERGLATLLLAMSNPLGLVLGQLVMIIIIDC